MHNAMGTTPFGVVETPIDAVPAVGGLYVSNNTSVKSSGASIPSVGLNGLHSKVLFRVATALLLPIILAVSFCVLQRARAPPPAPMLRRLASIDGESTDSQKGSDTEELCEELWASWSPLRTDWDQASPPSPSISEEGLGEARSALKRRNTSSSQLEEGVGGVKIARQEKFPMDLAVGLVAGNGFESPEMLQPRPSTSCHVSSAQEGLQLTGVQNNAPTTAQPGTASHSTHPALSPDGQTMSGIIQWMDELLQEYGEELEELHGASRQLVKLTEPAPSIAAQQFDIAGTAQPVANTVAGHQAKGGIDWSNEGHGNHPLPSQGWASVASEQLPFFAPQGNSMLLLDLPVQAVHTTREFTDGQQQSGGQILPGELPGALLPTYGSGGQQIDLQTIQQPQQACSSHFTGSPFKSYTIALPSYTISSVDPIAQPAQHWGPQEFEPQLSTQLGGSAIRFIPSSGRHDSSLSTSLLAHEQASAVSVIGSPKPPPKRTAAKRSVPKRTQETPPPEPGRGGKTDYHNQKTDYHNHLFYRLPKPGDFRLLKPFNYAEAVGKRHRGWLISIMLPLRELLVKPILDADDAFHVMRLTGELVSFELVHGHDGKQYMFPGELVNLLGFRFLVVDYVWSACEVLGTLMNMHLWWDAYMDELLTVPEMMISRPEKSRDHVALAERLLTALKVYGTGRRPCAREIVELKQELLCKETSPRRFRSRLWDPWRHDNMRSLGSSWSDSH